MKIERFLYMNIRHATERAMQALTENKKEEAKSFLNYATKVQNFIDANTSPDLPPAKHPPAVCCFFTNKEGVIHCGRTEDEPLFAAKKRQRRKLCHDCRAWCRARISELKKKIK